MQTDDEILDYARADGRSPCSTVGTCKMGSDPMAVVDERLRVRGIDGLRVVDASIMPNVISGNTNAPTIMIAEKGTDMIKADRRSRWRRARGGIIRARITCPDHRPRRL